MSLPKNPLQHEHVFLGADHARNEKRVWMVIALTASMMVIEIVAGLYYGSMALTADGWHMSTHAGAMLIAALAYLYARRQAKNPRFTFGTGKLGDLAGFASAIVLALVALLIGFESAVRLAQPVAIDFNQATVVAVIGLLVNLVSAWLLKDDHHAAHGHHGHAHHGHHDHDHPAPGRSAAHRTEADGDDHPHPHAHDHDPAAGHAHPHPGPHGPAGHDRHHSHDEPHTAAAPLHRHPHQTAAKAPLRDNNLKAAYLHVLADALTSVLAIAALLLGKIYGWIWLDPLMGIVGGLVIARWSVQLIRATGTVLVDALPGNEHLPQEIRAAIETDEDRITDLHVWQVGPGHHAAIVAVATPEPRDPAFYKARLADLHELSHVTVEVTVEKAA